MDLPPGSTDCDGRGTPEWRDYAIVKVEPDEAIPDVVTAGLFDEQWRLAR